MCGTRVLALSLLFVSSAYSFSWDMVVSRDKQLEFHYNGTLTHTEDIPSANYISSVTYDPVNYRLLFADYHDTTSTISSFDLATGKIKSLVTTTTEYFVRVVYEPVTQTLYWKEYSSIYWFSLNPVSSNKPGGNLLFSLNYRCWDLAVDSCGGYIYWITNYAIERARLDGSEREVLIDNTVSWRQSLAVDQQTQKIYWTERKLYRDNHVSIESANFKGGNRSTLFIVQNADYAISLAVSKDLIYWQNFDSQVKGIWQLPKYSSKTIATKLPSMSDSDCGDCHRIVANYTIKEQIQEIKSCSALQRLIPCDSQSESTVSVCQNYCFQGNCSVSADGQPICSCIIGYFGRRCEVNACQDYCLNSGVCSLNEGNERICQCTADFEGERCEIPTFLIKCIQTISMLKEMLNTDVIVGYSG